MTSYQGADVAVIGAGVSGLTAAYVLRRQRAVTLFEAEERLGGHAHTHLVTEESGRTVPLDSGFIVYNPSNYPLLTRLFAELGVATQGSEMSFSVSCDGCGLHYLSGSPMRSLPGQPPSIGAARWSSLVAQADRFAVTASEILAKTGTVSLGGLLEAGGYSEYFVQHIVLPLVCAVWSCGPGSARQYPAAHLFRFLANHGLLRGGTATRWRTVAGGSATYVAALASRLPTIRSGTRVAAVTQIGSGVEIVEETGATRRFGSAVIAVHPPDALKIRIDATGQERDALAAIRYVRSRAILHTDSRVLPDHGTDWGAWNYRQRRCDATDDQASISYHLNRLQRIRGDIDYVVTLNASQGIAKDRVIAAMDYDHPLYTLDALAAQRRLAALSPSPITYAGAYHGWGFHEDGCRSGVQAARSLGVSWTA